MIVRMPENLMQLNTFVFFIGLLIGTLWVLWSSSVEKDTGFKVYSWATSIIFTLLMSFGLMVVMAFNGAIDKVNEEQAVEYVETTKNVINSELESVKDSDGMKALVREVYEAEYQVIDSTAEDEGDLVTIGDTLVSGDNIRLTRFFNDLSSEEREGLLDVEGDSLRNFTDIELAKLDTMIKRESSKLGSVGSEEVGLERANQQEVLTAKKEKKEFPKRSILEFVQLALVVNLGFGVVAFILVFMILLAFEEFFRGSDFYELVYGEWLNESEATDSEEDIIEYELVKGDLVPEYDELEEEAQVTEEAQVEGASVESEEAQVLEDGYVQGELNFDELEEQDEPSVESDEPIVEQDEPSVESGEPSQDKGGN